MFQILGSELVRIAKKRFGDIKNGCPTIKSQTAFIFYLLAIKAESQQKI